MTPTTITNARFSGLALWASAVVIAALIIVQAGRMGSEPARADVVSQMSGTTVLTFANQSEDLFAVIDGRNEMLLVYRLQNRNNLELMRSYGLVELFNEAKAKAAAGARPR